jgi:hypothetical protein
LARRRLSKRHPLRCAICIWTAVRHQLPVGTTTGSVVPLIHALKICLRLRA